MKDEEMVENDEVGGEEMQEGMREGSERRHGGKE